MAGSVVVTSRIANELSQQLDALAAELDRTRAWVICEAIGRYVREESEFLAFLQEGVDDLNAGRVISHDDLIAGLRARYDDRRDAAE